MIAKVVLLVTLTASLLMGCGEDDGSCSASEPLADGASTKVQVVVVTKPGLDANIIGTLDVNGGLYRTPMKEAGPETDLPLGSYDGLVSRAKDKLTLDVEGQTIQLTGPEACD